MPAHLEVGDGDQVHQPAAAPAQLGLVEGDVERAEGQRVAAAAQLHQLAVVGGEALGDAAVVEIAGEAEARVERIGRRASGPGNRNA